MIRSSSQIGNIRLPFFFASYFDFLFFFSGLLKTIKLRSLEVNEAVPMHTDPSALGKPWIIAGEKNKKKRKDSGSPSPIVKAKKRVDHKPKKGSGSRVSSSGALLRLRDKPE